MTTLAADATDAETGVGAALLLALAALTDRQRHAIVARYWRDLTLDQIAAEMGVSRSAAGQLVKKATINLADLLGPCRDQLLAA